MTELKCPEGRKLVSGKSGKEMTPFCVDETEATRAQYLRHKAEIAKSQYVLVHRDCIHGLEMIRDGRNSAQELTTSLANIAPDGKRVCGVEIKKRASAPKDHRIKGPQKPMVEVNFTEARIYCQANGGDLPTKGQWEKATRGPSGTENIGFEPAGSRNECFDSDLMLTEVRSSPPNGYGLYGMFSNVWEWTLEKDEGLPAGSVIVPTGTSLTALAPGTVVANNNIQTVPLKEGLSSKGMMVRGGSGRVCNAWFNEKDKSAPINPDDRRAGIGFRCVSEPQASPDEQIK